MVIMMTLTKTIYTCISGTDDAKAGQAACALQTNQTEAVGEDGTPDAGGGGNKAQGRGLPERHPEVKEAKSDKEPEGATYPALREIITRRSEGTRTTAHLFEELKEPKP